MLSLAYIGGFFDADGSVSLTRRQRTSKAWGVVGNSFVPVVSFSQADHGLLEAIARYLEGTVYLHEKAGTVSSYGVKRNRDNFTLAWSNKAAVRVAEILMPHCIARRPELDLIIDFYRKFKNHTKGGGRGSGPSALYLQRQAELVQAGETYRAALDQSRKSKNTVL